MAKILTVTYYYINVSNAMYHDGQMITNLTVLDRKITYSKYISIIKETDKELVLCENPGDFPRYTRYYKSKEYAQKTLDDILKKPVAIPTTSDRTMSEIHLRLGGFKEKL